MLIAGEEVEAEAAGVVGVAGVNGELLFLFLNGLPLLLYVVAEAVLLAVDMGLSNKEVVLRVLRVNPPKLLRWRYKSRMDEEPLLFRLLFDIVSRPPPTGKAAPGLDVASFASADDVILVLCRATMYSCIVYFYFLCRQWITQVRKMY